MSSPHFEQDAPTIEIHPQSALADEPLTIRITGLLPRQSATLRAGMHGPFGQDWESQATFQADGRGTVDLTREAPDSGTYAIADPMGMVWSMEATAATGDSRPAPDDLLAPTIITFIVEVEGKRVTEATAERLHIAPGVSRQLVREQGLVGTFFQPPGPEPRPGVMLVGGGEGGLPEAVAALLASHGYATLALAYFRMEDLPPGLESIPLEYFQTAAAWLQSQQGVHADRLGVLGGSRGGELALLLGATFPVFTAVVSYLGSGVITQAISGANALEMLNSGRPSWTFRGQPLPYLSSATTPALEAQVRAEQPVELRSMFEAALEDATAVEAATIPVERTNGSVLLFSAGDDRLSPSTRLSEVAEERLARHQHSRCFEHVRYERAGHAMISPPYRPTTARVAPGPGVTFVMGGTTVDDARATADAWGRTLAFFAQQLKQEGA